MASPVATYKFTYLSKIVTIYIVLCEFDLSKISFVSYNSSKHNGWCV